MKRFFLYTLAFLFLAGCAPRLYCHPSKVAEDFEREKYDCEKVAEQSAANWGVKGGVYFIVKEMDRCLKSRYGWYECPKSP
jgi:hypothetical protein